MLDKFGKPSHGHDPYVLAKDFFIMTNDAFFSKYGFNWVPPEPIYLQVKRKLDSSFRKRMEEQLQPGIKFNGKGFLR